MWMKQQHGGLLHEQLNPSKINKNPVVCSCCYWLSVSELLCTHFVPVLYTCKISMNSCFVVLFGLVFSSYDSC